MSKQTRVSQPIFHLLATEVEGFDSLAELALDMRWSWNHATDALWRHIDSKLWGITHNPWVVLQTVSRERIEAVLADPDFRTSADGLLQARRQALEAPAWFQQKHAQGPLTCVAYFSMEFMLSQALPIYSGGLGNVAGDQLKATSDLGVPVVGVGLLYQQGYFRQMIDRNGAQQALFFIVCRRRHGKSACARGNEADGSKCRPVGDTPVPGDGVCLPPTGRLYGASHPALGRSGDSLGKPANHVATMNSNR